MAAPLPEASVFSLIMETPKSLFLYLFIYLFHSSVSSQPFTPWLLDSFYNFSGWSPLFGTVIHMWALQVAQWYKEFICQQRSRGFDSQIGKIH